MYVRKTKGKGRARELEMCKCVIFKAWLQYMPAVDG